MMIGDSFSFDGGGGGDWGFGDVGGVSSYEPSFPSFETPASLPDATFVDSYEATPVVNEDTQYNVVLPYEQDAVAELNAADAGSVDAAQVLEQLTAPDAVFVDPLQGQQAADALTQLLGVSDPSNAEDLAPAISFWVEVGQASLASEGSDPLPTTSDVATSSAEVFNENAVIDDTVSPEVAAAWEQVITSADEALDAMLNGPYEMDVEDVAAMQGVMAEASYAAAFGAQFEGNTGAAQEAAALALSYIASLEASGVDVTQYANLASDMQVLIDTGVMNLSHMEMNGIVETGHLSLVGNDGQQVTFDIGDLALMTDTVLPDGVAPPLVNADPTTDVGYDGSGFDLGPSVEPGSDTSFDTSGGTGDYNTNFNPDAWGGWED